MSEHRTTIKLEGTNGFCDWGKKDRAEMISAYRRMAEKNKQEAEAVLLAKDDDFEVYQHKGLYRERQIVVLHPAQSAGKGVE